MIARNPLHGSGQAGLPHPALALGEDAHAAQGIGMTDSSSEKERQIALPNQLSNAIKARTLSPRPKLGQSAWPQPTVFARNSFMARAISSTCVSVAKCPVSRNWMVALGLSRRYASAPAGMKKGSCLPQIASKSGFSFRKYSWKDG